MKNRAKAEVDSIQVYEGHWNDDGFVIDKVLSRSDLTIPDIKPNFIVYLTNGDKILVGWTDKNKQRLFYIKEFLRPAGSSHFTVAVVRMRGPSWTKTIKLVKRGMVKWFQGESFNLGKFVKQNYPQLIANELVSVQPMTSPTSLIFYMKYGQKTSS